MAHASTQAFTDHMQLLFGVGTCAGLSDGQLLARYLAGRDEAGELAFEALVARHGPMVMRVCRNGLDDPHDVHDAVQAVFLVLARRAGAIRDRQSVGSWLYGVAVRVTARARVTVIRRQVRARRVIGAAHAIAADATDREVSSPLEINDRADVVHQELSQLPERYRAPVVLCYLEGLTHDEAAARLSWPVGTVRSRLARARDRLRTRLHRRGVTAEASVGPVTQWLMGSPDLSSQLAATVSAARSAPIERELMSSIVRAAFEPATASTIVAASLSSTSRRLAQEVLNMMMLKKMIAIACALLPLGVLAVGGGMFLVRQSRAQNQSSPTAEPAKKSPSVIQTPVPKMPEIDPLLKQLLDASKARVETQRLYYEEGRITIDRLIEAQSQLEMARLMAAQTEHERTAIREQYVSLLKDIENHEKAEVVIGRGTSADVSEAVQHRLRAEIELKLRQDLPSIVSRLSELERQVEELKKERSSK